MPGGYKDTISSSHSHYNNQFRMDPGITKGYSIQRQARSIDSIETKQARIERQLQNQFHQNRQLPKGVILVAVQISRYVVLALVIPPYYILYEGPKWMILQMEPFFSAAFEKGAESFFLISTLAVDFWAGLGKIVQGIFKKPKKLIGQMQKTGEKAIKSFAAQFTEAFKRQWNPISKFFEKGGKILKECNAFLKKVLQQLPSFSFKFQNPMKGKLDWVKEIRFPKFQKPDFRLYFEKAAKKFVKKAAVLAQKVKAPLAGIDQKVSVFIENKVVLPLTKAFKIAVKPVELVINRSKRIINFLSEKVQEHTSNMIKWSTQVVAMAIPFQKFTFAAFQNLTKRGGVFFKQTKKIITFAKKTVDPIKRIIKGLFDLGKRHAKSGFEKGKQIACFLSKKIADAFFFMLKKAQKAPSWFFSLLKKVLRFMVKSFRKLAHGIRVVIAWTKVLVRHSLSS